MCATGARDSELRMKCRGGNVDNGKAEAAARGGGAAAGAVVETCTTARGLNTRFSENSAAADCSIESRESKPVPARSSAERGIFRRPKVGGTPVPSPDSATTLVGVGGTGVRALIEASSLIPVEIFCRIG